MSRCPGCEKRYDRCECFIAREPAVKRKMLLFRERTRVEIDVFEIEAEDDGLDCYRQGDKVTTPTTTVVRDNAHSTKWSAFRYGTLTSAEGKRYLAQLQAGVPPERLS